MPELTPKEFEEHLQDNFRRITNEDLRYFAIECRAIKMMEDAFGVSERTKARVRDMVLELEVRAQIAPPIDQQKDRAPPVTSRAAWPRWFIIQNAIRVACWGLILGTLLARGC